MATRRRRIALRILVLLAVAAGALWLLHALRPGLFRGSVPSEGTEAPPPSRGRRLSGRVLDAEGRPVRGAAVRATAVAVAAAGAGGVRGPAGETRTIEGGTTGADGTFSLDLAALPDGVASLDLSATRGPLAARRSLPGGVPPEGPLDLVLPREFAAGGRVLAAEDGRPLEGIAVRIGGREAATDARGAFRLEGLPASLLAGGRLAVEARGSGRRPLRTELTAPGAVDDLLLRLDPE